MSNLPNTIKTITKVVEFRQKEKGSLFIGISSPISSEKDATAFLNSIKKNNFDAAHHCYSFKLSDNTFKYSDDGEPSGTAGIRIYNAQNHFNLTNIITVVVRYFGGVKLGVGPLGKTYYDTAFQTLEISSKEEQILHQQIEIEYDFLHTKLIHHLISKYELDLIENLYVLNPKIKSFVAVSKINRLQMELKEKNISSVKLNVLDSLIYIAS